MEFCAATRTARDVDPQQDAHPVGGRVGLLVGGGRRSDAEQLAAAGQLLLLDAVGQQAVMPDAEEAVWKHVLEEAVDEFLGRKDIRLQAVAIAAVPVVVADLPVLASEDAVVADRNAMRVAAEVVQELARPGKRGLGVDHPGLFAEAPQPAAAGARCSGPCGPCLD